MFDLHRLVLLREVHLRGSLTAAAAALSYSPSAVSQQMAVLEREAGVSLLEKVGRGVQLTPAAEELVRHTAEVLTILERAKSDLAASNASVRGTLHLAAFASISQGIVPLVIGDLSRQYPALDVRFQQVEPENGLRLLVSARIDVLIADSYPDSADSGLDGLQAELLLNDPIRAYLPAGNSGEIASLDMEEIRWALEPSGTEAHEWVRKVCRQHGFTPTVAYESSDLLFHLRMVEAGLAAAFLPDLLVRGEKSLVVPASSLGTDQRRRISMICREGADERPSVVACRLMFQHHLWKQAGCLSNEGERCDVVADGARTSPSTA